MLPVYEVTENQCLIFLQVKLGVLVFIVLVTKLCNLTKSFKKVRSTKKCSRIGLPAEQLGSLSEPTIGSHVVGKVSQGDNLKTSQEDISRRSPRSIP